jgi:hypothetical protein
MTDHQCPGFVPRDIEEVVRIVVDSIRERSRRRTVSALVNGNRVPTRFGEVFTELPHGVGVAPKSVNKQGAL